MATPNATDALARKLPDPELHEFAGADTDETASVIVELDLPPQKLIMERSAGGSYGSYVARKVAGESPSLQKRNALKIEKTREFLESLLGASPNWLNSARAFVVKATPEQLREMALFPHIKTIRLNRHLTKTG
jgi:hypothetical protein